MKISHIIGGVLDTVIKIVMVVVIVTYAYKYALQAYDFGYRVFAEEAVSEPGAAKVISIYIPENATAMEIGKALEENGLIKDARLFLVQELLSGHHNELREGKYELSSDMTPEEMIKVLTAEPADGEEETDLEIGQGSDAEAKEEGETESGGNQGEDAEAGSDDAAGEAGGPEGQP